MKIPYEDMGMGHIFCLADPFDEVLRHLSPEYFEAAYSRLSSLLTKFGIDPQLDVGWMHPGYADAITISNLDEPGALFGWVMHLSDQENRLATAFEEHSATEGPRISWATCTMRLFRYKDIRLNDYQRTLEAYIQGLVDEPSDWSLFLTPDKKLRPETWCQLCFAAATSNQQLEHESWAVAETIYSPTALSVLRQGVEYARDCGSFAAGEITS